MHFDGILGVTSEHNRTTSICGHLYCSLTYIRAGITTTLNRHSRGSFCLPGSGLYLYLWQTRVGKILAHGGECGRNVR